MRTLSNPCYGRRDAGDGEEDAQADEDEVNAENTVEEGVEAIDEYA